MGFGSGVHGVRKSNKAVIKNFYKQLEAINKNYTYAQNELDKSAVYTYDEALAGLYQNSLNAFRNNSMVDAALGETGLEGRSQERVSRDVKGQTERQNDNIQSSFENAIYSIKSKKDALYVTYKSDVEYLRDFTGTQFTKGISGLMKIADSTAQGAALGAVAGGAFASGVSSAAGGATSGGFSAATMSSATLGGTAASGGFSSATMTGATLGGTATSGGFSAATMSGAGSSLMSAGSGGFWGSISSGWSNMLNNLPQIYERVNKYYSLYNAFSSGFRNQGYNPRSYYNNPYERYTRNNYYRYRD